MYAGRQFEAPEGFGSYQKGVRYYFCGDVHDGKALIVWFAKHKKEWRPHFLKPSRLEFENDFAGPAPRLKILERQFDLPPWLAAEEGDNFDELEECRPSSKKKSYRAQTEERLMKIGPALDVQMQILVAKDPLRLIVSACRRAGVKENHYRLQTWYFAYVLHADSQWALKRPRGETGKWSRRDDEHRDQKYGRHHLLGKSYGWPLVSMRAKCVASYLARCELNVTMKAIWRSALTDDFGCVVQRDEQGNPKLLHPENKPFPSYGQFRIAVVDELGLENIQKTLYGRAAVRAKAPINEGNYTGQYSNILDAVQVDAYVVSERPRAMFSDEPMQALYVAEGICMTTGAVVGVGFSLGGESGEAYRSLLFCMVAPKEYIAKIYGIPIEDLDWIMQGLSADLRSDRGPGGYASIVDRLEKKFPFKTIIPSNSGQSNACVESNHPRDIHDQEPASYVLSELNVPQMIKREIHRAVSKNKSKNISPRLSEEAIHHFFDNRLVATPHNYWRYLDGRMRTAGWNISLEAAVRAFWTPMELPVDKDGVRFRHRHYTSTALRTSKLSKKLRAGDHVEVTAYTFSLVFPYLWVEVDGRLIELEATTRVRTDELDLLVPISEFEETAQKLAQLNSLTRESASAAAADAEKRFEASTGIAWGAGERRRGSPNRPRGTAAHEAKVAKGRTGRRVA